MKDKLVSMAPFFVILGIVLVWGFLQGWFSPATGPEPAESAPPAVAGTAETTETPETAAASPGTPSTREAGAGGDSTQSTPPEGAAATWSTYHGDANLAGVAAAILPDTPARLWRFQTNAPILYGPVASEKLLHFTTSQGEVVAVDFTGKKSWSKQLTRTSINDNAEQPARVDGPVSCFDSTVLLGTMAGVVYALDAATGDEKWRRDIGSAILGAVTYLPASDTRPNARVYVIGQDDGALHCLAFDDGAPIWTSEPIDRCDGSPAAGENIITFGSCASALHVVNATDGTILQNVTVGDDSQIAGGVAVRGNAVFTGSHSGHVFQADIAEGKVVWTNEGTGAEVFTTPAVGADRVVYGSMDDFVYCLDRASGQEIWKWDSSGLPTSPVIAGDKVVVGSDGVLYMLSLASGDVLWRFEVSDEISSPSIINNMIVVGGKDGSLSAFGAAGA